ncbi:PREDICTED: mitochondrial dynamics protein MID49 [Thamnophis sirtalis]|uniref:Mitochondrial dynamics protein MID49 n=1 Tax=Thamnophis sirtalis TaxID=35019 RepID=A0A6I9YRT0_9SAUR|nr:PREDICTED: mitochondrial dynamics protein MID49 [Thamnophis sirtalis]
MATFAGKQGKRQDESSLGSLVDLVLANARVVLGVSGAAVLALATLAVKRFIDRATSPPGDDDDMKAKQKSLEESWQELSLIKGAPKARRQDLEEPLLSPVRAAPVPDSKDLVQSSGVSSGQSLLCLTLQEKLLSFYRDHVYVSETEKAVGKQLAEDIRVELQSFLKNKSSDLPFGNISLSGYLCDDLVGQHQLEVVFNLPLVLEDHLWHLIGGEETLLDNPWYGMIKRSSLEYFTRGSSPWDKFIVGGYLSSNSINDALLKTLVASVNWPVIGSLLDCIVRPSMAPRELKLEVRHEQVLLDITLCPVVETEGKTFLATFSGEAVENLWRRSFYAAEVSELKELDAGDGGIRRCCLLILKATFEKHPFWSRITGSDLTHVILHLSRTETDWSEAVLAVRLQQVLEELVQYLAKGSLPCFFDERVDLLSRLLPEEIDEIGCTLYEALAAPSLAEGLGL